MRFKNYEMPTVRCAYRKCKKLFFMHRSAIERKKTPLHFCCMHCRFLHVRDPRVIKKRFWVYINIQSDEICWEWNGPKDKYGYGSFDYLTVKRRVKGKSHRLIWRQYFGKIPKNLCVCHTCDNPSCCNPHHLFLGTHKDNMDDKVRKGRHKFGENCKQARLTTGDVVWLFYASKIGHRPKYIAEKLSVSEKHVRNILSGHRWGHIHV